MHTELTEALGWRYATSKFDTTKKVSEENLNEILQAGNLMPTAYGLQPFRFVVIEDVATKQQLVEHSYGQSHVAENSHLIVIAVRTDIDEAMITEYLERMAAIRGMEVSDLDGFKNAMIGDLTNRSPEALTAWAQKQTYLALGGMMAGASMLEIDNHALEGFVGDKYDEVLQLKEENLAATVILAVGYRAEDDAHKDWKKVRRDMEEIVVRK